jgi:hypothetical protein
LQSSYIRQKTVTMRYKATWKNRELLDQLDEKGKALALEQERLSKVHSVYKN